MNNEYDTFADIYDYDLGINNRDVNMYSTIVNGAKNVLILSCGTGREVEYLSNKVESIWGLDISEQMIYFAKQRTKNIKNITYILSDMRDFNINIKFDYIIIPNNGILHLLTLSEIENCLTCCKNHLTTNGTIVLDFFLPDYKALASPKSELIHDFTKYDNDKKMYITRQRIHTRNIYKRLNYTQIFYEFIDENGKLTKRVCEYTIRYLFPEELDLITRLIGLEIEKKYGGFKFEKYDDMSQNIVYELK